MMNTSRPRTFSSILTKSPRRRTAGSSPHTAAAPSAWPSPRRAAGWPSRRAATAGSARAKGPPCEPCKIESKLHQAKGLDLLFRLGGLERAAGGRDAVHVPGVHAVHGGPLAAHAAEVAHHKARRGRVERERQEQAATPAHAEAALRTERLGRVHFLG